MSMYGKYKPGDKVWPATDFKGDPGRTVQADREDADINKVIARYQKSGQLPPMKDGEPFFGDVSDFGDLAESYIKVREANDLFMQYPADVRERFENNPANMIEFLEDDRNRKEAIELGLVVKTPEESIPPPASDTVVKKPV